MSAIPVPGNVRYLENYPRVNPQLPELFNILTKHLDSFSNSAGVPWYVWIILIIIIILLIRYTILLYWLLETPANIRCSLNVFLDKFNKYGDERSQRQGLRDYISQLQAAGLRDSDLALTNFYVSSSNSPAIFTPLRDGIASPDALRLTFAAGARYLDFCIWSDDKKHNYRPILKGMDVGSKWRRITMTEMTFQTAMDNVVKYGISGSQADMDTNTAPYRDDPLFIMLRFKGKLRNETFTQVANILRKTIEQNRLDFTYNKGRGMDRLFKVPITEFFNKVIILANVYPPDGNLLLDYINIGPRSAIQTDISSKDLMAIPDIEKPKYVKRIIQNLTVSRSELEEPDSDKNVNDWTVAHSTGIHFAAMNFWSEDDLLKSYLTHENFGRSSFKIKPESLRYVIEYISPPMLPNPELNARDGRPRAPPGIIFPK
jgi:hypothetical protein